MATLEHPQTQRVVVALDASSAGLLALELAADLAAALRASLAGLYVEEEDMLHAADLPFVRQVRAQSGRVAPFTTDELERHWRALAAEARTALTLAAETHRIDYSFQVVRGRAAQVIAEATRSARLTSLPSGARSSRQLGSLARAALQTQATSLLLVPPRRRRGERWVAVLDTPAGAPAVLAMADALRDSPAPPLLLIAPGLGIDLPAAAAKLPRMALAASGEPGTLAGRLQALGARGLIVSADSPLAAPGAVEYLLTDGWPLLLAR
jgi:nucleotide-binding universal stress UspA family protein